VLVEVDDVSLGGGGGGTTPGESIIPANTGTARTVVTIATAHIRRNLLTVSNLQFSLFCDFRKIQKFLYQTQLFLARTKKLS
jgi:hypothetical protein